MNIILTGASGFIGSNLLKRLSKENYTIITIDKNLNDSSKLSDDQYYLIHAGSYILDTCRNALYNSRKSITDNILQSYDLIKELKEKICGICYVSTIDVYGIPQILPITENHPLNPTNAYAISKLATEFYINIECKDIPVTILRLGHVYGPNDPHPKVLQSFITSINNNKSPIIYGDGSDLRDYVHIHDVINAILKIIERKIPGIFNLASEQSFSIKELAEIVISHKNIPIIYNERLQQKTNYIFDISKFRNTFNYKTSILIEDGIRELL